MTRTPQRRTVLRTRRLAGAAALTVVLTACGTASDEAVTEPPLPPGATEATFVSLDALPDAVEAAIADASGRLGVPESEVAVAGALRVVWSDGSLGCPEPGTMYTQALVPGYLLTLEVDGRRVDYHGAEGDDPRICER
jgi:hypothetical protein